MAFENKAKTFLPSRELTKVKSNCRGFYAVRMMKGKKGKGKARKAVARIKKGGKAPTCCEVSHMTFLEMPQARVDPHGGKGHQKGTHWVESLTASPLNFIGVRISRSRRKSR